MNQIHYDDKASTVCLDATVVKRLREEQQLTQFYVSKVVGVTTDTISRWENNRYPTIRRENAIKLAEALEVSLGDILLKPVDDSTEVRPTAQKKSPVHWFMFALLLIMVSLVIYSFLTQTSTLPASVTAERILPDFANPRSAIPVQIRLTHRAKTAGIIIREYFPKGWEIVQSYPPASSLDNVNGVARWIIKAGDDRDRVVYLVQVDKAAKLNSDENFQGEIVASRQGNQSAVPIQGENKISVAPFHWVDADGNGSIDDGEMLEGSFTIEDMTGVHIDWNDLENLWNADSYVWNNRKKKFIPQSKKP